MKKSSEENYLETLKKRRKKSRVFVPHQGIGLFLAEILDDRKHKPIYMKLAREYDSQILIQTAKDIASRRNVENKGAYFMKVFGELRRGLIPKPVMKKPKQLKLKLRRKKT